MGKEGSEEAPAQPKQTEAGRYLLQVDRQTKGSFNSLESVRSVQFALFPSKWMHRGLAPTMKAAMNLIGIPAGDPYPPYAPLSRDELTAMAAVLKNTILGHRLSVTAAA
jgi:dihydrodipicolinate synthase/N-acetylneuraminate lyase